MEFSWCNKLELIMINKAMGRSKQRGYKYNKNCEIVTN